MALPKLFNLITWHNNTTPAINEDNLNAMSEAIDNIDDRVIGLAGTITEDVAQIQEDIEEIEGYMDVIDDKVDAATTAANNANTSKNTAASQALVSEGYAKGTQNGTPVGSTSPYYHNNAEYFMEEARTFTPEGYQDLVEEVSDLNTEVTSLKDAFTNQVNANGSKNILVINQDGAYSKTSNSVIWVFNDDGTIDVSTASGVTTHAESIIDLSRIDLPAGTYVISGCPSGGGDTNYKLSVQRASDNVFIANDKGSTDSFTLNTATAVVIKVRVAANKVLSSTIRFSPMLCLKSDYDLDPTFVPPAKTNRQLTQETTGLINNTMVNGAVNMFVPPYDAGNSTYSNIPITNNSDGSFTIGSGTISSTSVWCEFISKRKFVKRCRGKRIKLVIISNYTTNADFNVQGGVYDANDQRVATFEDGTDYINPVNGKTEKTIYVPSTAEYVSFRIWARATTTISQSFTIYPMLVVEGYDGEYVKGVMGNEELATPEYFDLSVRASRVSIVAQKNCRIGKQVFIWCKFTPIVSGADLPALTIPAKYCPPSVGNDMGVALNIVPKYNSPDRSNFMWALAFATGEIDVMSVSNGNDYLVSGSYYIA